MKEKLESIKKLQGHEIVRAMVKSLENPIININNSSEKGFWKGDHFHGPISLNAILHMLRVDDVRDVLEVRNCGGAWAWPKDLEAAINELRRGNISGFNEYLISVGKDRIYGIPGVDLPALGNNYPRYCLSAYRELAEAQKYYIPFDIQRMKLKWEREWERKSQAARISHPKLSALGMKMRVSIQDIMITDGTPKLRYTYSVYGKIYVEDWAVTPIELKAQDYTSTAYLALVDHAVDLLEDIKNRVHKEIYMILEKRGLILYHPEKNIS